MKCQSCWLFEPSRRSLLVVCATGGLGGGAAGAMLVGGCGFAGAAGNGSCPANAEPAEPASQTHVTRATERNSFMIRARGRYVRSVSRPIDQFDDVAEQEDGSG